MGGGRRKEGRNHREQKSNRQRTMEDIDGGLHPTVDGQSLGERWIRRKSVPYFPFLRYQKWKDQERLRTWKEREKIFFLKTRNETLSSVFMIKSKKESKSFSWVCCVSASLEAKCEQIESYHFVVWAIHFTSINGTTSCSTHSTFHRRKQDTNK